MRKIFQKMFKSKKIVGFFVLFLVVGLLFIGNQVKADTTGTGVAVSILLGWIVYPIVAMIGALITVMLDILINIFQYNEFINAAPVVAGWVIVRDICNMFFILILLVIAFATILRVEGYDVKKMIPKLIIMAVLINFSKTICGLIIDAANIVMNTFVNAFRENAAGGFANMLGMDKLLTFSNNVADKKATGSTVAGSLILALIFSLVSLVVIVVLLAVLIVRMVMIWIYIVLSPLAYLLSSFPGGKKYASQWWDDFTKNVITGPILAFFIWLAFTSVSVVNDVPHSGNPPSAGDTTFGTAETMLSYIISIGMLMGGLIIAQQAGGAIGKIAGAGMAKIQGGAKSVVGGLGAGAKAGADWLNIKAATHIGTPDLNLARQKERFGAALKAGKSRDLEDMEEKAGRRFKRGGLVGATGVLSGAAGGYDAYTKGFLGLKGWGKQVFGGLKNRSLSTEGIVVENRDKEDKKLKMADMVMSEDEYNAGHTALIANKPAFSADIIAAQAVQVKADKDLADAGTKYAPDSKEYEAAEKKKNKADDEVDNRQRIFDQNEQAIIKLDAAKNQAENTKDEKGRNLWITGANQTDQVRDRKTEYKQEANSYAKKAAGYTLMDFEGLAAMRAADREAGKKITSNDENELIAMFDVAVSQDDAPLARALMQKIGGVNGTNALFARHGYQATRGFNEKEYADIQARINGPDADDSKKAKEEYEDGKGTHDFFRDTFVKELGMDKQRAFAFQNDMASIGEERGADHLKKTVVVDSAGNYHQASEEEHTKGNLTENLKMDAETVLRKNNRLYFGAEDKISKIFKFSAGGLAYAMSNLGIIFKEMNSGRLNKSTAKAFSQPGAENQLRAMMNTLGIKTIRNGKDKTSVDDFFKDLRAFSAASREDTVDTILAKMAPSPSTKPTP